MNVGKYTRKSVFWVDAPGVFCRGRFVQTLRGTSAFLKSQLQPLIDLDPEFLGRLKITDNSGRSVNWETLQEIREEGRTYGSTKGFQ